MIFGSLIRKAAKNLSRYKRMKCFSGISFNKALNAVTVSLRNQPCLKRFTNNFHWTPQMSQALLLKQFFFFFLQKKCYCSIAEVMSFRNVSVTERLLLSLDFA